MFSRKIPVYYLIICIVVFSGASYLISSMLLKKNRSEEAPASADMATTPDCAPGVTRLTGFNHIGPIANAAKDCEAGSLMPLKMNIASYIEREQQAGNAIQASVYLRRLADESWMNVNPNDVFHPASLLKVPQLIAYLKKAESEPGLLEKKFLFEKPHQDMPNQYYSARTLQPGHSYTIKELFHFMIVYSDNNANMELVTRMDMNVFEGTFKAMKLTIPNMHDYSYQVSTRDYSKFLELLFNASYLSIDASEYATELLAESTFKEGLVKKIPKNIAVAHKMGEWGDGNTVELHDCGIVYVDKNPYIISVMTRGRDMARLSDIIANISSMAYDVMSTPAFATQATAQR
ncbi:hypothetical protein GCM10023093_07670 [Nemorincola caseinilytica]|uniref:beta-lactamase n=1 Tax=Nemorincola caseinilytica TaxID=2054315 RepID=A0ABP8N978_9BACT